jgi:DNA-binding transcriptional LysR family regulator
MRACMGAAKRAKKKIELERWDDLSLLLSVARAGSFTRAAQTLGIEQSTVSRRIRGLEASLGVTLFERHPQRSTPTPTGQALLRRAEAVEAEVIAFVSEASESEREVRGHVRLALTESIAVYGIIPQILPELRKRHPSLSLELVTSYQVASLGHREAEIALRFFRPESGDLVAQRVATMPTALLGHERLKKKPLSEVDLIAVAFDGRATLETEFLEKQLHRAPWLITSSYLVQIEAVRAGLGAALLPRNLLDVDSSLVELAPNLPSAPKLELWLVTPRSLRRVPRIDAVWSALESGLGKLGLRER